MLSTASTVELDVLQRVLGQEMTTIFHERSDTDLLTLDLWVIVRTPDT